VRVGRWALTNIVAIAAGEAHSLALRSDGTVIGWGNNANGEASGSRTDSVYGPVHISGRTLEGIASISAGGCTSLALKSNGTVVAWGKTAGGVANSKIISGLSNIVAVAAGWGYGIALKADGTLTSWGERQIPGTLTNVVAIAPGCGDYGFGLALSRNGTVSSWGPGGLDEPVPEGLSNVVSVASGGGHCLALRNDGCVVGWGGNFYGEATGIANTNPPFFSQGLVKVAGVLLTNVIAVAAGSHYSMALKRDGTVSAWGFNPWHTVEPSKELKNVTAIAAGTDFCLAITTNVPPPR
jgi:alpha-tubulin suppressor-like RCC1 family protein